MKTIETNKSILIIEDNYTYCIATKDLLESEGFIVDNSFNIKDGLTNIEQNNYDLVLLDLELPDGNGLSIIPNIKKSFSSPEVIILTGYADNQSAKIALENGVWDYIEKGSSYNNIILSVTRALSYRKNKKKNLNNTVFDRKEIVGSSWELMQCIEYASNFSNSDSNVLITGETGTGKENFARAIHLNSNRKNENFVVVDCTVLPENLVESIIFGHLKGAFTSADKQSSGLIAKAEKGTLFLDEIGDLPLNAQKSFLRVLQEKEYRPVGNEAYKKCDFRLIAATNRDLMDMVKKLKFRKDLFYRINANKIELPPLRNRQEDVVELINYFLPVICQSHRIISKNLSKDCLCFFKSHNWPGNIRELILTLESMCLRAKYEETLDLYHLPKELKMLHITSSFSETDRKKNNKDNFDYNKQFKQYKKEKLESAEKEYFSKMLQKYNRDIKRIQEISKLSKSRLYSLLSKYKLI